jgi:hypothetical protein
MEAVKVILINFAVLAIGLILYIKVRQDMRKKQVPNAPEIPILVLVAGFCGWLALLFIALFGQMSGIASVEYLVLLVPLPLIVLWCIGWLFPLRKISRYHRYALAAGVVYLVIPVCIWAFLLPSIFHTKW